jgi:rod shape-determining protein MreB
MRDGVIADYRMTTAMLSHFIKKAMGFWSFIKPEVMVSVPAGVTSTERRAVVEAALKAGAKKAHVVREPIVAAIGAGIPINEPTGHMVVDIGGGTTDVAVISLGSIQACTSVKCAGNKIDHAIAVHLKKAHNLAIGDRTAEKIKIKIGSAIPVDAPLEIVVKGRDYISGLPRSVTINTNEIVEAIDGELRQIIDAIKVVLQDSLPELASDIIDTGIVMTGGSSQLRNLTELVYRRTGVKCILAEEPLYAVVRGIGIALDHLDQYNRALISKPF